MNTRFTVVIGLDVGKSGHHACALDLDGEKLFDKPLPQDQATLRDLFTGLQDRGSGGRGHVGGLPSRLGLYEHAGIAPVTRRSGTFYHPPPRMSNPSSNGYKRRSGWEYSHPLL